MVDKVVSLVKKSVIGAQKGDLVAVREPEYDVVNDGRSIRMTEAVVVNTVLTPSGLQAKKEKLLEELKQIDIIIAEMKTKSVEGADKLPD
jgi:hypothetical protein